jgi:hypothetical protein
LYIVNPSRKLNVGHKPLLSPARTDTPYKDEVAGKHCRVNRAEELKIPMACRNEEKEEKRDCARFDQ